MVQRTQDGGAVGLLGPDQTSPSRGVGEAVDPVFGSEVMQGLRQQVKQNLPVYLHHQVYVALRDLMVGETLRTGDRLPTQREIASYLHIGSPTVRQAVQRLVREGRLVPGPARVMLVA